MPAFMGGGAEAVCCWILQALEDYDVTLFTLTPPEFERLDEFYGTSLAGRGISVVCPLPDWMAARAPRFFGNVSPLHPWRQHFLARAYRRQAGEYDLAIGSYNEMDLGEPGIQYVHCPQFVLGRPWLRTLWGYSQARMTANETVACSRNVADRYEGLHGAASGVLHPPTPGDVKARAWEEKEPLFVALGRIVPAKLVSEAIDVIEKVRERGHEVRMEVWGAAPNAEYLAALREREAARDWLHIEADAGRAEYCEALSRARYQLHLHDESYGIVIAEAVRAGAVPFVPDRGGQLEIVGDCPPILFRDAEDAVDRIDALLGDEALLADVRERLQGSDGIVSPERFMDEVRGRVERALAAA